jgi:hypothetical protein
MDDGFTLRDAVNTDVEKAADAGPKDKREDFQLEKYGHTQLFRCGGSSPVMGAHSLKPLKQLQPGTPTAARGLLKPVWLFQKPELYLGAGR